MTLPGKVFAVLSVLLALVFLVFTTPVAKTLIDLQKDVLAIEFGGTDSNGQTHRAQKEIDANTDALDLQRVELQFDLNRLKQSVSAEWNKTANQVEFLKGQLAIWNDMEKAERQTVIHWKESTDHLNSEIQNRAGEKERLQQELAAFERLRGERHQQVGELQAALDDARKKLAQTLETMQANYLKLEKLVEAARTSTTNANGVAATP